MNVQKLLFKETKYRPVLNTLALKYIAVVILCLSQLAICLRINLEISRNDVLFVNEINILRVILNLLINLNKLSLPLMIAWMVSQISGFKDNSIRMVIFYGLLSILFYVGEILFFLYYLIPTINYLTDQLLGFTIPKEYILSIGSYFSSLNVFIDLFLCALIYLFLFYTPKKIRSKKGIIVFRSLSSIPILYIVISFIFNILINYGYIVTNIYTKALFPSKGLINYFIFITMMLYLLFRERIFNKVNKNKEFKYEDYKKTNRYVINYSIVACLIFIFYSLLDTLIGLIPTISSLGFGNSLSLLFAIPFLLIHDFTAKPINKISVIFVGPIYGVTYLVLISVYISMISSYIGKILESLS